MMVHLDLLHRCCREETVRLEFHFTLFPFSFCGPIPVKETSQSEGVEHFLLFTAG
jgi:hypothetical protein